MATDLAFNFQDEWNPVTGVPDLASLTLNDTTDKSKYWVVIEAGPSPVGVPPVGDPPEVPPGVTIDYAVGDGVAWNGEKWVKIPASDLALSKVMALEDFILSTEIIGNEPALPITTSVTSETNCYVDNSVFTKWGVLKEVKIFTRFLGAFYLLHFRKDGTNKWTEFKRYPLATTSSTDYTSFSAASVSSDPIHIEPGDCFGFLKRVDTPNPSASVGTVESVSGKFAQIATATGGIFSFTSASFPNSASGSTVAGRKLALEIISEVNAVVQNSKDIAALQNTVGQHSASISTLTTGLASANTNITQNTTSIGTLTSDLSTANTKITQNTTNISTLTTGLASANITITKNNDDIAALKSEIFVIPDGYDWNNAANVSKLAYTTCIISHTHNLSSSVTLPTGIRIKMRPDAKFHGEVTDKMPSFNLLSGWTTINNGEIKTSNSFCSKVDGADGRVRKTGVLQTGAVFTVHIKGTTEASFVQVSDSTGVVKFTPQLRKGDFDITVTTVYTGTVDSIIILAKDKGLTTIETFEVHQNWCLQSPCAYGVATEKNYPVIENVSGAKFLDNISLSGMFKAKDDTVLMSEYFTDSTYPAIFFDSFVKTRFIFDKNLTQTGEDYNSINFSFSLTDAPKNYQNYRGLSEGCSIEGKPGVVLSNLFLYATGDFAINNITINNGRVNICNFYNRPLKLAVADCTFTNVSIDNKQSHALAVSVMVEADICDSAFTVDAAEPPVRNVFYFLSVINSRISNCRFAYPNYVWDNKGQPIILQSSVNSVYENNIMDNGDSGLVFFFSGPTSTTYSTWIELHAMDFKGFENNIIRGNTMYNMLEEAFTCDSTDSIYPTLTMNRNYFQILSLVDNRTAVIKLKAADEHNYATFINTMMTSITKVKFGKYCKIVKIVKAADDTDYTKFVVTGSRDFFKDAAADDQYAVTYAFYNNVIENNRFINCCVPVLLYLYAFHNTVRGNSVFGGNDSTGIGNMRVLSYSAKRKGCYIAPSIDNVFENNILVNNGLHILCSKNKTEWPNDWLTNCPVPYDDNITRDADLNTVIRGNVFKDTAIKLQGLTGCIFENNQLINTPTEITDTSFYSEMGNLINESDNIGIDNLFARAEAAGNTLIPLVSRGDGCIRLTIGATGDLAISVNGNAFLYDNETDTTIASRYKNKTYTPTDGEVIVYARCLSGEAQLIISNAFKINRFGNDNDDLLLKYDLVNSPDIYMLKSRFLPQNLIGIKQTSTNYSINLRGNVSNLPNGLLNFNIDDSKGSLLDGYIKDIPRLLTFIHLKNPLLWAYTVALRGDLADLPANCTSFHDETASGVYTYSSRTWSPNMKEVYIRLSSKQFWTCNMVDQLLIDLSNATWESGAVLYLSGGSTLKRSSSQVSTDAVALLYAKVDNVISLPPIGTSAQCLALTTDNCS